VRNETVHNLEVTKALFDRIEATDGCGRRLSLEVAFDSAIGRIAADTVGKLMFIGNGASASIASHMATDFWKNTNIRAVAFNDCALLTCMGNDYGYADVFAQPIRAFADPGDVLVAISSSGRSPNILAAVTAARDREARVITFSGFQPDNPLRLKGDVNFYVPAFCYGPVEVLHHAICHGILDAIVTMRTQRQIPAADSRPREIAVVESKRGKAQSPEQVKPLAISE
jgi:D-sedoheptulose 7-phosphate isomerase